MAADGGSLLESPGCEEPSSLGCLGHLHPWVTHMPGA